eukprot:CAMPEP_0171805848 /NCGR_PEP_ID=MMETSP0991-20121206/74963_1 /TAXON_ID=483369 /ORGANISM="non described non described, Strain CCMP2098" /LENGTH=56 /DNA_ID=CAMNT_0012418515 /DNA_START=253 /DNA_END=419 /DNA_ORIENTATION=+
MTRTKEVPLYAKIRFDFELRQEEEKSRVDKLGSTPVRLSFEAFEEDASSRGTLPNV